jgi:isopenicillin-N N-acyltransferase like protein
MPLKFITYKLVISGVLIFLLNTGICQPVDNITAQQSEKRDVPLIELSGDSYNRGLQHGTQLKKEIAAVFAKWKMNIRKTTKADADSMIAAFTGATDFEPITRKYIPGILEEMKGIADGSGQSYADVFAFQLVDEFWVYLDKQANIANHHCSGIGVPATANHPAYIAQNIDLENYMHGFQVLLHLAPTATEPEQYIVSCAGLVALNGMNEKGIGLCVNTLMELQASVDGLPVAFIVRGVLRKQNGNEAMKFLKTVKHASGQNYILGIADSVYNFEASGKQVVRYLPKAGESSVVYHTNHALVNHDVKDWYKKYHEQVLNGETKNNNSETRFTSLHQRLNKQPADISTDVIKATLRSKDNVRNPVCRVFREGGGGFTFSSTLFTLGGKRSVQITYGSPDQSEYREYFFKAGK